MIQNGAWMDADGVMQSSQNYYGNITTSVAPISEHSRIQDNYNGSFDIFINGLEGSMNLTSYHETIDQTTLRVIATSSSRNNPMFFNYSGYYGHTSVKLPSYAQLGSLVMMNVGPSMDIPFVVVGTGSHHGRGTWILGLHGDYANAFGIMTNHTIFTEFHFYQVNRLMAALNTTDHSIEDYGYQESMVSVNVLMSSFDAAPNTLVDNGWAEYKMTYFQNATFTSQTAFGNEWWFTGPADYSGRFIFIENRTMGENSFMMANYINYAANNETRYLTSISGMNGSTFPDLNVTVMPDFMHVPTTLGIWDLVYIYFPDSGPRMYKVVNFQLMTTWLGSRDAYILHSLDGNVNVAYDRQTGLMVSYYYQHVENSTFKEVSWEITHSNILDPYETIDLPLANYTLCGFSIEYDSGNITHVSDYQLEFAVLSNNGIETLVEQWFHAEADGWQRFTFRNNRLLWLDSIDSALAPFFYPNASGSGFGFLSTC
nr:hypothetical protein [Candidatus Sigynarchaeota archaeon]